MGFEMAKSSIFANQKAIDVMGNNLTNVDTAGYSRQRVDRTPAGAMSYTSRVANNRIGLAGQGVEAMGVSQVRDDFLDKCFRDEFSKASYHNEATNILNSLQSALGDGQDITDESGLFGAITQMYESLNDFVQAPSSETEANLVMLAFKNTTQVLHQLDSNLDQVTEQFTNDMNISVNRVNEITAQIAHLNHIISEDATVVADPNNEHYQPNELLDERNLLLDELSSYGNIDIQEMANGMVNVQMGGHSVVNGSEQDMMHFSVHDDKTVDIRWMKTQQNVTLDSGRLLADLQFINGRGTNVQSNAEEPYQGIPYYRDQIDMFASALADMVNHAVPEYDESTGENKVDAYGNIVYKTLLGAETESGTSPFQVITANNITISDEWATEGGSYFIYNKNENVEDFAQYIAVQLTDGVNSFTSHGETYSGTFADFEVNFLGKLGSDLSFHEGRQDAYSKIADDFLDQRDAVSGVSQDEETADMLKYQKSYEAASRLMTVLDELIDVVINRMGRAGL